MGGIKTGFLTGTIAAARSLRGSWLSMVVAALAFGASQANPPQALAQSGTWNSSSTTPTSWSNTARWAGGIVAGGTNNTATFANATATVTTSLLSNIVLGNLTTGSQRVGIRSGTSPVNASLTNEQIQFATTTGTAPAITNNGRLDIFAIIAGSQGFTKSDVGALWVNRPNTYTGVTTIAAGDVRLGQNAGLGDSSAGNGTVIQSGAMLRLDNGATSTMSVTGIQTNEPFTIAGDGVTGNGALRSQNGVGNAFNGPITLSANASIKANVALTLGGAIDLNSYELQLGDNSDFTISGGFVGTSGTAFFNGAGAITLSGSSSFTGTTLVGNETGLVTMTGYMAGPMNLAPGAGGRTLVGTGTFAGGLTMGQFSNLAPGATQASTDYATITASSLTVQTGTASLGILDATTYDKLVMTAGSSGLTLGGSTKLALDFSNVTGNLPEGSWNLLSFNGLTGNWGSVVSTGFYAGTWIVDRGVYTLANVGTGGVQTLTFTQSTGVLAVVPEPATIALLGGLALGWRFVRGRRQSSQGTSRGPETG